MQRGSLKQLVNVASRADAVAVAAQEQVRIHVRLGPTPTHAGTHSVAALEPREHARGGGGGRAARRPGLPRRNADNERPT